MSTSQKGDDLEIAIFTLFRAEIDAGRFFAKKSCCRIFRRKGYYSQDRQSNIIFDISIEIYLPGADDYSVLLLIECKNYAHAVPVDDVEEFFTKTQQVGAANTKAIVVASSAFQSGALTFARSKKMGLARYFHPRELKWELRRSASLSARRSGTESVGDVELALTLEDYRSMVFDLFMQSPRRNTNAAWDFFEDLILDVDLDKEDFRAFHNPRGMQSGIVPFLDKSRLELQADKVLEDVGYEYGFVELGQICSRHPLAKGLRIERLAPLDLDTENSPLGRISFKPLKIELFTQPDVNIARDRFTFAHELAHLLLGHGRYMRREYCEEPDYQRRFAGVNDESDVTRMEYQANYFAACLLMPRRNFVTDFLWELRRLDLHNKGFGPLYVDSQECNMNSYFAVTNTLMKFYGASRSAVSIRLEGLGLLRDMRSVSQQYKWERDLNWMIHDDGGG